MPRPTLPFANLEVLRTHDLVRIELPTGQTAWLGSGRVTVEDPIDSVEQYWEPTITTVGDTRQSLVISSDKVQMSISNVNRIFGLLINDAESQLAGATCYFLKYFEDLADPDNKTAQIVMKGEIANVTTDEGDVTFTLLADLSVGLAEIGGQQVQSHCPLTFKGRECGWTEAQGGDATYCDKQYFSPNGCSGHNNRHRFQGVIAGGDLTEPILNGGGGVFGGGGCFVTGTKIETANGEVNIESVNVGDYITSFDADYNLSEQKVARVYTRTASYYYRITFEDGSTPLRVAANHPLKTQDDWILSQDVKVGTEIIGKLNGSSFVKAIEVVEEYVTVYNFEVSVNHTYIADGKFVHNNKPANGTTNGMYPLNGDV